MKKIFAVVLTLALTAAATGCTSFNKLLHREEETSLPPRITEAAGESTTSSELVYPDGYFDTPVTEAPATEAPTTEAPDEPTTEAPVEQTSGSSEISGAPSQTVSGAVIVGYSSKGYEIAQKDGFTYVGGVLVVNKTYTVPSSYYPGGLTYECSAAFDRMANAAAAEGISLWVQSGFRSYETQNGLYTRYCNSDGQAAADRYSARPGHSEHQTGLGIDVNEIANSFKDTPAGKWLVAHCAEYGFILRYPAGKESQTGYMYEPWHIRYLGDVTLAQNITNSGLCLEEYFGISSVYA